MDFAVVRSMNFGARNIFLLGSLLFGGASLGGDAWAGNSQTPSYLSASVNVNSRYIIEAVEISGYNTSRIAGSLRTQLQGLVGTSYDTEILENLARELRKEIHAKTVTQHIARGSSAERVKVVFEVTRRTAALDISVPKFLYHSKQGWSAQVEATTTVTRNNNLMFGVVSDGDELTERYAGIHAGYENLHVGTDKVKFRFLYEDYHEQWNRTTVEALSNPSLLSTNLQTTTTPEIYRSRQNYQPVFSFSVSRPFVVFTGISFERLHEILPSVRTEAANAALAGFTYRKQWGESGESERTATVNYDIRLASRALGSNYVYSRHRWVANYTWSRGNHQISDVITAGLITGRAPLFERFVVGTSSLLRGWNRYDIDPLGGNRLIHNSVDYRYRMVNIFYDAGSLWSRGNVPTLRHSLGIGVRQSIFSLAVAFPVRENRVEPTFMVGMNY